MAEHTVITDLKKDMEKRIKTFEADLTKVRTGRASINVLDGVQVDYYGTLTPLSQVATLTTPDARMIVVSPFEKKMIQAVEKGIQKADLGLSPTNDGNVVRVGIPPLTEDRRKDLVKSLKKIAEEVKVALRLVRRDFNELIKKLEKSKDVAEDEGKKLQADVQKHTDGFVRLVDDRLALKEKEVMTI